MSFADIHSAHANKLLKSTLAPKQIIDTFEYCAYDGYDRYGPQTTEWYFFVIYKEENTYLYHEYHAYEDFKDTTKYILCSEFKSPVLMILPKPNDDDDEDPSSSFFEHSRRQQLVTHLEDTAGVIDEEILNNISRHILDNITIAF